MGVAAVVEGEAVDFVEGAEEEEEAEGGSTTMTEGEVVVVDGAEVEEAEEEGEGEVVCVAEENSQTSPLPVVTGSALIKSKSAMQIEQDYYLPAGNFHLEKNCFFSLFSHKFFVPCVCGDLYRMGEN